MDISKQDFIRLTTQGYPITLRHPIDDFYGMFSDFVNQSKENNFFAEVDEGVKLHAGMRTEVCKIVYDDGKVIILSRINDNDESSSAGEFDAQEEYQILGMACLGVLYFCDLYALATGQNAAFASANDKKTNANNNTKYDIWPM
jgi:hypothetical protein